MKPPLNTRKAPDELQLVEGLKISDRVGLDRDASLAVIGDKPHAPAWADVIDAGIRGQVIGYELGRAAGLREAADELDAEVLRERAAAVIRGAVASMGVKAARDAADERARQIAARWSAA